jgi:DNA-binding transcriptional LysR family regulator
MFIDKINLNHIRIFECVYRTRSMTKAAEELYMTQSGISQHIKQLEVMLDVRLFDRIKQRLVPTNTAVTLFDRCSESLYSIEKALMGVKGGGEQFSGEIGIGLPIEFGNNVVLPLLAAFGKKHPGISFKFEYGLASTMNDLLIKGILNFAIVDDFVMDKLIDVVNISNEKLFLCCLEDYLKGRSFQKEDKRFFESLDYIDFAKEAPLSQTWFRSQLKGIPIRCNVRSSMVDVQGVAKMVTEGFGVGIIPDHLLQKLRKRGYKVHTFKGSGTTELVNKIGLALIRERTRTPAVEGVINYLISSMTMVK